MLLSPCQQCGKLFPETVEMTTVKIKKENKQITKLVCPNCKEALNENLLLG